MLTNKIFYSLSILFVFVLVLTAPSCIEKEVYLNSTQLKWVDTLVKRQVIPMRLEIDSLCDLQFDQEVKKATDSIVIVRIRHINKQLGK